MKFLGIISVDFDVTDQLLIRYRAPHDMLDLRTSAESQQTFRRDILPATYPSETSNMFQLATQRDIPKDGSPHHITCRLQEIPSKLEQIQYSH
jgi:Na+-translocating ferredoxin:NAD+ oxidoreductase RnfC subunit